MIEIHQTQRRRADILVSHECKEKLRVIGMSLCMQLFGHNPNNLTNTKKILWWISSHNAKLACMMQWKTWHHRSKRMKQVNCARFIQYSFIQLLTYVSIDICVISTINCLKKLIPADVHVFIVVGASNYPVFHPTGYWKLNMNKRITFGSFGLNVTEQMFRSSLVSSRSILLESIKHLLSHDKWMCMSVFVLMCVRVWLMCCSELLLFANSRAYGVISCYRATRRQLSKQNSCWANSNFSFMSFYRTVANKVTRGRLLFDIISVYFSPEREMMMKYKNSLTRKAILSGVCSNVSSCEELASLHI